MKNILRTVLPTALLLAFMTCSALAQTKTATVDLRKLFDGYWKTKQSETILNDHKAELAKEDKGLIDDFNKAKEDYKRLLEAANDQAVSSDERARRKQVADDKLKQISNSQDAIGQFEKQAQTNLADQSQRMRQNILTEIRAVVAAKGKAGGYTVVLDSAAETANGTPLIIYNSGENDLTAAVLAQLNTGAPIDTKPAAAPVIPATKP
jgi:outer membrane protein